MPPPTPRDHDLGMFTRASTKTVGKFVATRIGFTIHKLKLLVRHGGRWPPFLWIRVYGTKRRWTGGSHHFGFMVRLLRWQRHLRRICLDWEQAWHQIIYYYLLGQRLPKIKSYWLLIQYKAEGWLCNRIPHHFQQRRRRRGKKGDWSS